MQKAYITVQFEDGTTMANQNYDDFLAGSIAPTNTAKSHMKHAKARSKLVGDLHIGEAGKAIDGMEATIIEWTDKKHIIARTADGKTYTLSHSHFLEGKCLGAKDRMKQKQNDSHIGVVVNQPLGLTVKITAYNNKKVEVLRNDGKTCHMAYSDFLKGKRMGKREAACEQFVGKQFRFRSGNMATGINAESFQNLTIRTDTGYVKEHVRKQSLLIGNVGIPKEYWPDMDG